jgi:hypothetical protein
VLKEGMKEVCKLELTDKTHEFKDPPKEDNSNAKRTRPNKKVVEQRKLPMIKMFSKRKISINEKGDKIMLIYKSKENGIQYARLVFDKKKVMCKIQMTSGCLKNISHLKMLQENIK